MSVDQGNPPGDPASSRIPSGGNGAPGGWPEDDDGSTRPAGPGTWERVAKAGDGPTTASSLLRLGLLVTGVSALLLWWRGVGGLVFVVALGLMIMLHEAGHFTAAKAGGMKVTEFFLGFGPRLWSFRRGETEYGVKALPLGGYVKIIGMNNLDPVDPADEARTYRQASFPRRFAVAIAGSTVHMILAFMLLLVSFAFVGDRYVASPPVISAFSTSAELDGLANPGRAAGLEVGDRIVAVNGKRVRNWNDVRDMITVSARKPMRVQVERDGATPTFTVTPLVRTADGQSVGFIGLAPATTVVRAGAWESLRLSFLQERDLVTGTVGAIGSFFTPSHLREYSKDLGSGGASSGSGSSDDNRFLSAKGAIDVGAQAFNQGLADWLWLLVIINVSVGVLNMIPLLPLDGGHVAIAVYERMRSRRGRRYRADIMKMLPLTYAVVMILLVIGVSSFYQDIVRPPDPYRQPVVEVTK